MSCIEDNFAKIFSVLMDDLRAYWQFSFRMYIYTCTCKSSWLCIADSMQNTIQTYFKLVHNGVTPEKPVPFFPQPGRFRRNVVPQNPSKRKVDKLNGNAASLGISARDLEPYFTTGKLRSGNKRSLTGNDKFEFIKNRRKILSFYPFYRINFHPVSSFHV